MTDTAQEIVDDVLACLTGLGEFTDVRVGPSPSEVRRPSASVMLTGHETRAADDGATQWHRLRLRLAILAGGGSARLAVERADVLFAQTCQALAADPFRGGRACHLPLGPATHVGAAKLSCPPSGPPVCELSFEVTCHYETAGEA